MSCAPASGSVFAIGTTAVACTATDHVGNAANGSFTVTVRGAKDAAHPARRKRDRGLEPARQLVKAQLLARLQPLIATFDPSNPAHAKGGLHGVERVRTALRLLSGHGIPPTQATAWIADANRIKSVISC